MKNIVLIGMPGAGKSTIGVLLAKTIGYRFVDCDLLIQDRTGELLYETIERDGIDAFLQLENEVIAAMKADKSIIATGGSAIFGTEAMEHLKENGTIVYLKLPADEIERRVSNITTRGIAMKLGDSIHDIYDLRAPLYEAWADVTINCKDLSPEEVIAALLQQLINP